MIAGNLCDVILSTLAQPARDVGSILTLGTIFPIFITHMTLVAVTMILYKLCTVWLLNLPLCEVTAFMHVIRSIERLTIPGGTSVVVYTDLLGKKLHRQVDVGTVVTSGSLGGIMVSTLAQNASDVGSIPLLGTIFPIFITPTTLSWSRLSKLLYINIYLELTLMLHSLMKPYIF